MNGNEAPPCLFIANIFAPIRGGSATVYETLARLGAPGERAVLTAWRHYGTGQEITGWAWQPVRGRRVHLAGW